MFLLIKVLIKRAIAMFGGETIGTIHRRIRHASARRNSIRVMTRRRVVRVIIFPLLIRRGFFLILILRVLAYNSRGS